MNKTYQLVSLLLVWILLTNCQRREEPTKASPNIVYILADDLGYGDISSLNPDSKIQTPQVDKMAENGMVFTDAHSGSAVCTPTRYGILTGRYAWRTSLQNGVTWSWDEALIAPDRTTVGKLLQRNNYHTACIGKWHLGLGWAKDATGTIDVTKKIADGPNTLGFDYFYGITASLDIPPYFYIENDQITATSIDTIEANDTQGKGFWRRGPIGNDFVHEEVLPVLTQKAVSYINEQSKTDQPFFLYFPLPAPHTPILPTKAFLGKSQTNAYGDFVVMVDDVVGQIRQALAANGISENTILIFTSDNGCSPRADYAELAEFDHDPSYVFRGHKADIYEGGHRIPFILEWPAKVQKGSRSHETICLTDLMATCAALVNDSLAAADGVDSYNLSPLVYGQPIDGALREATVHHSINGSFSIRQDKWKLAFCPGSGGWSYPRPAETKTMDLPEVQLFDLEKDVEEQNNLVKEEPEVVARLTTLMEQYIRNGRSTPGSIQRNDVETILFKE